jgi:hypothetical protein
MTTVILATFQTSAWPHFGGSSWVRLQYVLGLRRLGIEVVWVDRLRELDPRVDPHSLDYLHRRFAQMAHDFGFTDRYALVYDGGRQVLGMDREELQDAVAEADLLLNISGHLPPTSVLCSIPIRAYVDVDPGFTQIWAHQTDMHLGRHNRFFTVGQNVVGPDYPIPLQGVDWQPTLPPVVLAAWPARSDPRSERITTVGDWRGSQDAVWQDEWYGGKREEFLGFLRVPLEAGVTIDLVLCVGHEDHEDLGVLLRHGWRVEDPYALAGDPHSYQELVQRARAEFSVAKRGYVRTRCGWLSDRTACFLASGKPAIVQSTGFEPWLPTGKGLLTFRTVQEAVDAVHAVQDDYAEHASAARAFAEAYLDSDVVLTSLLERAGLP